jgi:hypothetical protein
MSEGQADKVPYWETMSVEEIANKWVEEGAVNISGRLPVKDAQQFFEVFLEIGGRKPNYQSRYPMICADLSLEDGTTVSDQVFMWVAESGKVDHRSLYDKLASGSGVAGVNVKWTTSIEGLGGLSPSGLGIRLNDVAFPGSDEKSDLLMPIGGGTDYLSTDISLGGKMFTTEGKERMKAVFDSVGIETVGF